MTLRDMAALSCAIGVLATLGTGVRAQGAGACGDRQIVIGNLDRLYDETLRAHGIGPGGTMVVEIFASDAGTWTILYTGPDGLACFMAAGDNFETMVEKSGEKV